MRRTVVDWQKIPKPKNVKKRVNDKILELSLRAIRKHLGVSQTELAEAISMTQSDLSKLERRSDHLLSTLRTYVEALGGKLEVSAVFADTRITLVDV